MNSGEIKKIQDWENSTWLAFLEGDDQALAEIYSSNIDRLYNYGRQFTRNKSLVKDTVQDIFFQLIDDRDKLSPAKSVKAYLFACLRRKLLENLKRERKEVDMFTEEEAFFISVDANSYFIDSNLSIDQKKLLEQHCNDLPVRQREIIMMRFFEGLPYEEIAEIMGLANAKTVRTMMYRGLNKLSESLSPYKSRLMQTIIVLDLLN